MKKLLLALVAVASPASVLAQSAVPNLMSYQSRVADAAGVPLGNTTPVNRIVLFRIYDSPNLSAPANRLYSEQQTVTIAAGEFSVLIGSGTAISTETTNAYSTLSAAVFGGATRYLGVTVDDGDGNPLNDPEMSPRQQIVGTPFAFRAQTAEAVALGGVTALSLANNAVTTAAIAPGAVTSSQLGTGAVNTTAVADAAVTSVKIAADSIDSSKIADGSVAFGDLSPALQAAMPKPSFVYNQGLAAQSASNTLFTIFPIDVSDLGVDGEVLISYVGGAKSGLVASKVPAVFTGQVRVNMLTFTTGGSNLRYEPAGLSFLSFTSTAGGGVPADTNTPFVARNEGPTPESNYSVSGFLNSTTVSTVLAAEPASAAVFSGPSAMFPRMTVSMGGAGTTVSPYGVGTQGVGYFSGSATPLAMLATRWVGDGSFTGASNTHYTMPVVIITHYYPGSLLNGGTDQSNVSTNTSAGGPNQLHSVSSVVTGTNKLTITLPNAHVMQVGDTVVIAGMTGAPAANASYTVSAVPDRNRFEITLAGATGTYSGGTVTHTPRYYKYRLWVAVNTSNAAVRLTVSDK